MRTNAKWIKFGGAALALGALYLMLPRAGEAEPAPPKAQPDQFAFVRSMEGTRPDGDLKVDAAEQLVVDAELGHLFDYYLAGLGEKDLAAIKAEIERELTRRLKPGAAQAAKRLLAKYLDYKRALAELEATLPKDADMLKAARARRQGMHTLRQKYFSGAESAGLFGFSDAYDEDALARLAISQDQALGAAERQQRLDALDARMPAALREERAAPGRIIKMEENVATLRARGATDDEIYRLRAAAVSPDAAARLADLDREEAAWKARIATYQAQRANLLGQTALAGGADPQAALQQLRDAAFTADEQRRLSAYEQ